MTPIHLTTSQYRLLRPDDLDTTGTKGAKKFLRESGCLITPDIDKSIPIDSFEVGKTKRSLQFLTPKKSTNAIYRWKVEVLEGDNTVAKRLIGKSSSVRKRLNSYFTALRQGHGTLAKVVLKSLRQHCKQLGLTVSFGIIHSNVDEKILSRVEDLVIRIHKASNDGHVLNERRGGGGSSKRKPLCQEDIALVQEVAKNAMKNLPNSHPLQRMPFSLKSKIGVIYDIENKENGKHYIGKTVGVLSRRMSQHFSAVHTLNRAKPLHHDIKKAPHNFQIRVLYQAPAKQRHILEEIEHIYIKAFKADTKGYNRNSGTTLLSTSHARLSAL